MNYVYMGICFALNIYSIINKIVSEKKFGHMKKKGQCVYLPEFFFWFGLITSVFLSLLIYFPPIRNEFIAPPYTWGYELFFLVFNLTLYISVSFAQANSRIYYDDDHIYYSTFFGNRYTFNYEDIIGKKPSSFDTVLLTTHRPNIRVETTGVSRKKFLRFVQLKQKEIKANAKALEKASALEKETKK